MSTVISWLMHVTEIWIHQLLDGIRMHYGKRETSCLVPHCDMVVLYVLLTGTFCGCLLLPCAASLSRFITIVTEYCWRYVSQLWKWGSWYVQSDTF